MEATNSIPKVIHYCWFGRGEKSKKIKKCMKSWEKHLHDYTFVEWNEDNFDPSNNTYTNEAYKAKKYAFVSDYVRLHALYEHGGIYLDTDVEVLNSLDVFLHHPAFSGFEDNHYLQSGIIGATLKHPWIGDLLDDYMNRRFLLQDGTYDMMTNTAIMTEKCHKQGLVLNGEYQEMSNGVAFYPRTYFSPYDHLSGGYHLTDESYTIHHFSQSWLPAHVRYKGHVKRWGARVFGPVAISKVRKLFAQHP